MNTNTSESWNIETQKRATQALLKGNRKAKYAVIGGGFTGLSLALHLAEQVGGSKVCLIEKEIIGFGASGFSSGMIGPGICGPYHKLVAKLGEDVAHDVFKWTNDAVEKAVEIIDSNTLDCDLTVGRQYKVAVTEQGQRRLQTEYSSLKASGFDVSWCDGTALKAGTATDQYLAGMVYKNTATMQPRKLIASMVEALAKAGVRMYENSEVSSVEKKGKKVAIKTEQGAMNCEHVVIATNAQLAGLGFSQSNVFPVASQLAITKPISDDTLNRLGLHKENAVIENRRIFNYFRLTADKRLIFGGGMPFVPNKGQPVVPASGANALKMEINALFPDEPELTPDEFWSGVMGFTIDNYPIVSLNASQNITYAGAWCGHGLALSIAGGQTLANALVNESENTAFELPWFREKAPWIPPGPLLRPSLNAYAYSLKALDYLDKMFSSKRKELPKLSASSAPRHT